MFQWPGYRFLDRIYESERSIVFRAIREADQKPCVIKVVASEFASPGQIARFKREYELLLSLQSEHVIRAYELQKFGGRWMMSLEDFGGDSLHRHLAMRKLEPLQSLRLAVKISRALGELHAAGVIHKDINPSNIVWNAAADAIKLIDFGIAARLSREIAGAGGANSLEGTIPYISPEQTGRMNRAIDYRSDYYSFGATLYRMFSGQPPFDGADRMEVVHAHIARTPAPLNRVNPEIPATVARIVDRLLAKTAEDRYQSARGLIDDLERAALELERDGDVSDFALGLHDRPDHFTIPQKLYGRAEEIDQLMRAFARASAGRPELLLVSGYSGVGKSALVQEIRRPTTEKRGRFVSGKFDQFKRNSPYSSLLQAFQELLRQTLAGGDAEIADLRSRLSEALGDGASALAETLPEIGLILGVTPAPAPLPPAEAENRLHNALVNFLSALATAESPLTLFLDDLQWADSASLKLLKLFVAQPGVPHLLFIGAYRDNEVDAAHPLHTAIEDIRKTGANVNELRLRPLNLEHVQELIADTLGCPFASALSLAEACMDKTHGNPFFLAAFLQNLHDQGLIVFDPEAAAFVWDSARIRSVDATENVVDLMSARIDNLASETREIVQLAACIGAQFDLNALALVFGQSRARSARFLAPALNEGLLLPLDDYYRYAADEVDEQPGAPVENVRYRFLHDRVQQAAYLQLSEARRRELHLRIGRLLHARLAEGGAEELLFDVAAHLNLARDLIVAPDERRRLAGLNLEAGNRAKNSAAYAPAFEFLKQGLALIDEDAWREDYELALELYANGAEAAYLTGDFSTLEALIATVETRARTLLDKVKIYEVRLQAAMAANRSLEAVDIALPILEMLGVSLPRRPGKGRIMLDLLRTAVSLLGKSDHDLQNLPLMTDPQKLAAMRILSRIGSSAYIAVPNLFPIIVFRLVQLSVRYGATGLSSLGFASYGLILAGGLGLIERGYRYGMLAPRLLQSLGASEVTARTLFVVHGMVRHWKEPVANSLADLRDTYQAGLHSGDFEFASYCAYMLCIQSFYSGKDLEQMEKETARYSEALAARNQRTALNYIEIYRQLADNLANAKPDPAALHGPYYDERLRLPEHQAANDRTAIFFLYSTKTYLAYVYGDDQSAQRFADLAEPHVESMAGAMIVPWFYFYAALSELRAAPSGSRRKLSRRAKRTLKMMTNWAAHSPANYANKKFLLDAEALRVRGLYNRALQLYDASIDAAQKSGFLHEEAVANELAAGIWLRRDKKDFAGLYIARAIHSNQVWGARAVARALEELHQDYARIRIRRGPGTETSTSETSHSSFVSATTSVTTLDRMPLSSLDFISILKASQALSGEIVLSELLKKLMRITIENAGARSGSLLLERAGRWGVEAYGAIEGDQIVVFSAEPGAADEHSRAAMSIVNFVARTHEVVVLRDARDSQFSADPHFQNSPPGSVMCLPLLHQGRLNGILYFENPLASDAFTPDRLEVLHLLSVQIAGSIANSRLYSDLQESLEDQTRLTNAYSRFVPQDFMKILGKSSIVDVQLGDQIQREMTVLFSDIRDFTGMSESMSPQENFNFLNGYLGRMEPVIGANHGFIDKYVGDAIMALFPATADNAVRASVEMLNQLREYNRSREVRGYRPLTIGIGLNTGLLMLGTVGGRNRMDGTVISDAVNLASRIEGLTKVFGAPLLLGEDSHARLEDPTRYNIRTIAQVRVKGKSRAVTVYEIFDGDAPEVSALKRATLSLFEEGRQEFLIGALDNAAERFRAVLAKNPADLPAAAYLRRCSQPADASISVDSFPIPE